MNRLNLILILIYVSTTALAQTNNFPETGNVAIRSGNLYQTGPYNLQTHGAIKLKNYLLFDSDGDWTGGNYYTIQDHSGGNYLRMGYNWSNHLVINSTGNIGIGISNPQTKLHVSSSTSGDAVFRLEADTDNNNENDNARIEFYQDGGSLGAYIGFNSSWGGSKADNLFRIGTRYSNADSYNRLVIDTQNGNIGIGTTSPAGSFHIKNSVPQIILEQAVRTDYAYIKAHSDNDIAFGYAGSGEVMRFDTDGNVGIGYTNPAHKLTVNGIISATEVKVSTTPNSDYVFEPDYDLKSIEEVESFIKENKHLPDIPSAEDFKQNGVGLGEMDDMLLRKVEELTLYVIELKKENQVERRRLKAESRKNEKLKEMFLELKREKDKEIEELKVMVMELRNGK